MEKIKSLGVMLYCSRDAVYTVGTLKSGLKQRVKHCRKRLRQYCEGVLRALPELEEDVLPFEGAAAGESRSFNNWAENSIIKPNK